MTLLTVLLTFDLKSKLSWFLKNAVAYYDVLFCSRPSKVLRICLMWNAFFTSLFLSNNDRSYLFYERLYALDWSNPDWPPSFSANLHLSKTLRRKRNAGEVWIECCGRHRDGARVVLSFHRLVCSSKRRRRVLMIIVTTADTLSRREHIRENICSSTPSD